MNPEMLAVLGLPLVGGGVMAIVGHRRMGVALALAENVEAARAKARRVAEAVRVS